MSSLLLQQFPSGPEAMRSYSAAATSCSSNLLAPVKEKACDMADRMPSRTVIKGFVPSVTDATSLPLPEGPHGRKWHTTTLMKNKLIVLGGEAINKQFMRDVLVLDLDTMTWHRSGVALPDPVAGHSAVAAGDSVFYYGGISRQGVYYGTLYRIRCDPSSGEPLQLDEVPTRLVDATALAAQLPQPQPPMTRPHSREGQSWTLVGPGRVVMFGGFGLRNGVRDFFNDVHVLDFHAGVWTKVDSVGMAPTPRFYHSASLVGAAKLWVHGGWTGYSRENDFYVLDLEKLKWKRVVPLNGSEAERRGAERGEATAERAWSAEHDEAGGGVEVPPRSEHATVVMGRHIVVAGGMGAHSVRDDLCVVDTERLTWHAVPTACSGGMTARSGLTASLADARIYVVGGHHDLTALNSVFLLRTERPIARRAVAPPEALLRDAARLWEQREAAFVDVTLVVEGGHEVAAHRALLWARCPYFRSMFASGMAESTARRIELGGVPLAPFMHLLEFVYTAQCAALAADDLEPVKAVLILANEFAMEDLVALCENRLIDAMDCWNVVALLELAAYYFAVTLRTACVNFISNNYDAVAQLGELDDLPADVRHEIARLKAF